MGRHSAAGDDEGDDASAAQSSVAVVEHDDRPAGRHSAHPMPPAGASEMAGAPEMAGADTARIPLITDPVADQPIPESETVLIPVITAPLLDEPGPASLSAPTAPTAPPTPPAPPAPKASGHATAADIALIRGHGDIRARAIAAVLVPFVVYVVYWLVVGGATTRSWLIWIWIPVIVAGVLFGVTLDLGHRRYGPPGRPSADDSR